MQQQMYHHSQMVPHLQYGSHSAGPAPPANNHPRTFNPATVARFESNQMGEQQLAIFGQSYPISPGKTQQFNTSAAFGADIYNDETIYTEPTLLDHDVGRSTETRPGGNLISVPLPPPPPPPPIFTVSAIDAATTTSSINDTNAAFPGSSGASSATAVLRNSAKGFAVKGADAFSFVDHITRSQSCESVAQQPSQSQLTITGQDLEITLNNGEITQTVLSNPVPDANHCGPLNPHLLYYYSNQRIEFLPLCDLLFNIISLAAYFCDVVFDSVTAYTLYLEDQILWLVVMLLLILTSAAISQLLSYKWYLRERRFREQMRRLQPAEHQMTADPSASANNVLLNFFNSPYELRSPLTLTLTHILLCGVLLRYFKLFVPVNLSTVKREVRDLCVLRMVHGFFQAGPMLLLQLYLVWMKPLDSITDLNIISICLSLFSLCWALSSFSKNIRQCQIHKLVLTWLGVIFQFFWRIGTVTSRIVALTIYATVYQQWIFVVLFLHWFSMLLWLSTPNISSHSIIEEGGGGAVSQKKPTQKQRVLQNALIAWVYIFCFINMENANPRHKMAAFYLTMFLENTLLLCISMFFDNQPTAPWYRGLAYTLVFGGFSFGMFFMWLYYRFFHIRHLKHTLDGVDVETNYNSNLRANYPNCQNETGQSVLVDGELLNYDSKGGNQPDGHMFAETKASPMSRLVNALSNQIFPGCYHTPAELARQSAGGRHRHHFNDNIPGVFNCRLNPALKRKKKKPSTIPPPPLSASAMAHGNLANGDQGRMPLETIDEVVCTTEADGNSKLLVGATVHHQQAADLFTGRPNQCRRNVLHQVQRPSTNTSMLRQPSADTFWRKSTLSARSLSISPSAMLKSESSFQLPTKHPFSSTITTPTSPVNFMPTENFTDKLEACIEQNESNAGREARPSKSAIIRPKPIVRNSLNLDGVEDFLDDVSYANDPTRGQQLVAKQANGTLLHYYYNPQSGKLKLRSQTPEVLLYPHADSSRIFYDYPSTVISMPKNDEEDLIFTRQCQRPPVPGKEGDDKSEENDNANCSYVEGKRSLLNYGLSRTRLEKILEKRGDSHKSHFSHTLPGEAPTGKGKQARYATGQLKKKKKYTSKNKRNSKRTSLRAISQHSIHSSDSRSSSPSASASHSSSGEEGDIESDINQHERVLPRPIRAPRAELQVGPNLYDQVHIEQLYDEALASNDCIEPNGLLLSASTSVTTAQVHQQLAPSPQPRIIRGPAHQYTASQDGLVSQKLANYHMGEQAKGATGRSKRATNGPPLARPKPLYHSAKYKRHNTPL